jgi:hypothetical protein
MTQALALSFLLVAFSIPAQSQLGSIIAIDCSEILTATLVDIRLHESEIIERLNNAKEKEKAIEEFLGIKTATLKAKRNALISAAAPYLPKIQDKTISLLMRLDDSRDDHTVTMPQATQLFIEAETAIEQDEAFQRWSSDAKRNLLAFLSRKDSAGFGVPAAYFLVAGAAQSVGSRRPEESALIADINYLTFMIRAWDRAATLLREIKTPLAPVRVLQNREAQIFGGLIREGFFAKPGQEEFKKLAAEPVHYRSLGLTSPQILKAELSRRYNYVLFQKHLYREKIKALPRDSVEIPTLTYALNEITDAADEMSALLTTAELLRLFTTKNQDEAAKTPFYRLLFSESANEVQNALF